MSRHAGNGETVEEERKQWLETVVAATDRSAEQVRRIRSPYHNALVADLEALAARLRTELAEASRAPTEREERIAQNEILFREVNERIRKLEQGWELRKVDFVCECGDPSCTSPVTVTLARYEAVRQDPRRFIVLPGHEIRDVEQVVERHEGFLIVEKHLKTHEQVAAADAR